MLLALRAQRFVAAGARAVLAEARVVLERAQVLAREANIDCGCNLSFAKPSSEQTLSIFNDR